VRAAAIASSLLLGRMTTFGVEPQAAHHPLGATEALASRARLIELDREMEALLERRLMRPSSAACPAWGPYSPQSSSPRQAPCRASAPPTRSHPLAGMAPVLRQSGRVRFLKRPTGGNKGLKRVFYQSAFCSLGTR
jgi:hypothetical protein